MRLYQVGTLGIDVSAPSLEKRVKSAEETIARAGERIEAGARFAGATVLLGAIFQGGLLVTIARRLRR